MKQWHEQPVDVRARRASRALRPREISAPVPGGCDRASVVTRDLVVWLSHAGNARIPDVASWLGLSIKQVHRILTRLRPYDDARGEQWALLMRCRINPTMQEGWYAELREGWPWRRAGRKGNRGGGRRPAAEPAPQEG